MGFKIATDPKFKATVRFKEPTGTDEYKNESFIVEFRVVPQNVITSIVEEQTDNELVAAIVVDVENVTDNNGNAILVSDGLIPVLCNIPYVRKAIIQTYFDMINGTGAQEKN
ncbi:MAG: hypothetical protein GQ468_05360 [Candidatus Scalindua sp.]|nr:hypothetical protein [Candidatus Scalindua sp.]